MDGHKHLDQENLVPTLDQVGTSFRKVCTLAGDHTKPRSLVGQAAIDFIQLANSYFQGRGAIDAQEDVQEDVPPMGREDALAADPLPDGLAAPTASSAALHEQVAEQGAALRKQGAEQRPTRAQRDRRDRE